MAKYPFIITGVVILLLLTSFIFKITQNKKTPSASTQIIKQQTNEVKKEVKQIHSYIVQKGDYLWKIAEAAYGSGFNAYDIAKANKIDNPSKIFAGQKLILPDVELKPSTTGKIAQAKTAQVTNKIDKYTVQQGDHLWKIAEIAYGDGMNWTRIAKANKINNPDIIETGQILKIE